MYGPCSEYWNQLSWEFSISHFNFENWPIKLGTWFNNMIMYEKVSNAMILKWCLKCDYHMFSLG